MEFHDDFPQYEFRDQHDEVEGKKQRRRLWNVFWIMLAITLIELVIGSYAASHGVNKTMLKITFITFTIVKAYYIVYSFMHLGHEVKALKWIIIGPYTGFILYLVFMATVTEGNYARTGSVIKPENVIVLSKNHPAAAEAPEGGEGKEEKK